MIWTGRSGCSLTRSSKEGRHHRERMELHNDPLPQDGHRLRVGIESTLTPTARRAACGEDAGSCRSARPQGRLMHRVLQALIGDLTVLPDTVVKTCALAVTAALLFRFTERRTLAELAPFDWITAVAAGSIVGRAATASETSWLGATSALIGLFATHSLLARLRSIPRVGRLIDPPLRVLIRDGVILHDNVRRSGLTQADLYAVLRQHGHLTEDRVHLAIFEAKGAVSVLPIERGPARCAPQGEAKTEAARWARDRANPE